MAKKAMSSEQIRIAEKMDWQVTETCAAICDALAEINSLDALKREATQHAFVSEFLEELARSIEENNEHI